MFNAEFTLYFTGNVIGAYLNHSPYHPMATEEEEAPLFVVWQKCGPATPCPSLPEYLNPEGLVARGGAVGRSSPHWSSTNHITDA